MPPKADNTEGIIISFFSPLSSFYTINYHLSRNVSLKIELNIFVFEKSLFTDPKFIDFSCLKIYRYRAQIRKRGNTNYSVLLPFVLFNLFLYAALHLQCVNKSS